VIKDATLMVLLSLLVVVAVVLGFFWLVPPVPIGILSGS
jgi:hypothetical protein